MIQPGGLYDYERPMVVPTAVCRRCGASVGNVKLHNRWHEGMCGHVDHATGLSCMNPMPCDGLHLSDLSEHTWSHP